MDAKPHCCVAYIVFCVVLAVAVHYATLQYAAPSAQRAGQRAANQSSEARREFKRHLRQHAKQDATGEKKPGKRKVGPDGKRILNHKAW